MKIPVFALKTRFVDDNNVYCKEHSVLCGKSIVFYDSSAAPPHRGADLLQVGIREVPPHIEDLRLQLLEGPGRHSLKPPLCQSKYILNRHCIRWPARSVHHLDPIVGKESGCRAGYVRSSFVMTQSQVPLLQHWNCLPLQHGDVGGGVYHLSRFEPAMNSLSRSMYSTPEYDHRWLLHSRLGILRVKPVCRPGSPHLPSSSRLLCVKRTLIAEQHLPPFALGCPHVLLGPLHPPLPPLLRLQWNLWPHSTRNVKSHIDDPLDGSPSNTS